MLPDFAVGNILWEAAFAAITFGAAIIFAFIVHPLISRIAKLFAARTATTLDDILIKAVQTPVFILILVIGLFMALSIVTYLDRWQGMISKAWIVAVSVVVVIIIQRLINGLVTWYGQELAHRTETDLDNKLIPLVRRILTFAIYSIALLLILNNLGVEISALIAGLGLGGLAVALALQPALGNLFSSAMMVSDGVVSDGDFIELHGGPMGSVLDVGWRSTKIMTPQGNIVSIPNSKLADTIFTNYQKPKPEMAAVIFCGVAYESNLVEVERIALEVCLQVRDELPQEAVVKSYEPILRFREFGDSNITFLVVMRATDRGNTFLVTHEVVKRLHERFGQEGIEINYPVRKILYPEEVTGSRNAKSVEAETSTSGSVMSDEMK